MIRRRLDILFYIVIFFTMFVVFTKIRESSLHNFQNQNSDFNENDTALEFNTDNAKISKQQQQPKSVPLKKLLAMKNVEQKILNEKKYGPVTKETIFITIQVHNRIEYLKYLIDSFRNAKDIDKALLIFSHDVYENNINELIQNIDFAMVMQIFYPYSIQLYPNVFPGTDPRDCGRDIGKEKAIETDCFNSQYPDTYGHYRESKYTQMKHHWWWKLNRIFDELKVTKELKNFILLLVEEDHYVAPDFIYIYKRMQRSLHLECPKCNIIALGTYSQTLDSMSYNQIEIAPWTTNLHNMGMAFNKTTWLKIRNCAEYFCTYDEYNYDFSLQNINRKCLKEKLFTALIRGPRIYHVGECGIHHAKTNCDVDNTIKRIDMDIKSAQRDRILFPEDLEIVSTNLRHPTNPLINNGGWADKRDHCLCLEMTANKKNDKCHKIFPATNDINDL
ncbi:hypothetical protein ACKWTF_001487 [Chironomus riparius]